MHRAIRSHILQSVLLGSIILAGITRAQSTPTLPNTPEALRPPKDQVLIFHLKGKGNQIYTCQNDAGTYAWKLKAPEAVLLSENGEQKGRHFGGPTWEANDGSRITGKLVASVLSPDPLSISWLLLSVVSHDGGRGIMTRVESIQRLNTKGGKAPGSGCDASHENAETSVHYEASYYFYGTP